MKCLSEELLNLVYELNAKCFQKLEVLDEETKERNATEYVIIKNYIQKKDYKTKDLAKVTNKPQGFIFEMVKNLGFIRFRNRKPYINKKNLDGFRSLTKDFIMFLNYPIDKELNNSIKKINSFMRKRNPFKNFKIILINAFESAENKAFSNEIVDEIKLILKNANWAICKYFFQELFSIYLELHPELIGIIVRAKKTDLHEPEDSDAEEAFDEDAEQLETEISINPRDLMEQNQKLNNELSESRAVCDFLTMQYDDLMVSMDNLKKVSSEQDFRKVFLAFNSIENNNVLDAFFIAKSTLDTLLSSGWEPFPPELKSILYIFDLFAEFFNRQTLTTNYKLGEEVLITIENIFNFEYKGQELKKGMEVLARVRSPAWYYKGSLISKASVLEIIDGGKE